MRPTYIIAACVAALVVLTTAQVPVGPVAGVAAPIVPPVFPPMFAGMPFPFLGPFGFPFLPGLGLGLGLGFGGLGLGLGLGGLGGIGRLGLGLGGVGRLGLRGKRQANASLPVNEIRCVVSTTNNTVQCSFGIDKQVGCQIESRLSEIPKLHVNLVDLMVMQHVEGNIEFLNLVSTKPISAKLTQALTNTKLQSGTFTFIHPSTLKPILLGIYGDATLGVPGFLVKDQLCYNSLVSLIKTNIGKVRSNLIIA